MMWNSGPSRSAISEWESQHDPPYDERYPRRRQVSSEAPPGRGNTGRGFEQDTLANPSRYHGHPGTGWSSRGHRSEPGEFQQGFTMSPSPHQGQHILSGSYPRGSPQNPLTTPPQHHGQTIRGSSSSLLAANTGAGNYSSTNPFGHEAAAARRQASQYGSSPNSGIHGHLSMQAYTGSSSTAQQSMTTGSSQAVPAAPSLSPLTTDYGSQTDSSGLASAPNLTGTSSRQERTETQSFGAHVVQPQGSNLKDTITHAGTGRVSQSSGSRREEPSSTQNTERTGSGEPLLPPIDDTIGSSSNQTSDPPQGSRPEQVEPHARSEAPGTQAPATGEPRRFRLVRRIWKDFKSLPRDIAEIGLKERAAADEREDQVDRDHTFHNGIKNGLLGISQHVAQSIKQATKTQRRSIPEGWMNQDQRSVPT